MEGLAEARDMLCFPMRKMNFLQRLISTWVLIIPLALYSSH